MRMTLRPGPGACIIDFEQWSEKCKRSYSYFPNQVGTYAYEDHHYACVKCGAAAVFTAEDQKFQYEVRKRNINMRRRLCPPCSRRFNDLRAELRMSEERWVKDKSACRLDRDFLVRWLGLLEEYASYRPYSKDAAAIARLRKLLAP